MGRAVALGLLGLGWAAVAAGAPVVVFPPDGFVTATREGVVIGYEPDPGASSVPVRVNGRVRVAWAGEGVFRVEVAWRPGENRVEVGGTRVAVTYAPEVAPPSSVHPALEKDCRVCHRQGPGRQWGLAVRRASLCLECHEVTGGGLEHEATPCLNCHAPHASPEPALIRPSNEVFCLACHFVLPGVRGRHDGAYGAAGRACTACHFRPAGNGMCHACHTEKTEDVTLPHRTLIQNNRCTSCHPPHREGARATVRCRGCHLGVRVPEGPHRGLFASSCEWCHTVHPDPDRGLGKPDTVACVPCHTDRAGAHAEGKPCRDCHALHGE
ncbi:MULTISPECIES: cytochrome c3 family protein [Deferrisoma]